MSCLFVQGCPCDLVNSLLYEGAISHPPIIQPKKIEWKKESSVLLDNPFEAGYDSNRPEISSTFIAIIS